MYKCTPLFAVGIAGSTFFTSHRLNMSILQTSMQKIGVYVAVHVVIPRSMQLVLLHKTLQ